jgi:hypothetical protein
VKRLLAPGFGRRVGVVVGVLAIAVQLSVLSFVAWGAGNVSTVRDWLVVGKVAESARLNDYAVEAGLSSSGRFYLFAANPTLHTPDTFDEACPQREAGIAALGCYSAVDDTIHLLDITDDALTTLEPVVAAHEALHAVWARLDSVERSSIAVEVEKSFSSVANPALLGRLAIYESLTPAERSPELFAIMGTESANVTPALEAVYARYFDDRLACVELAASSANIIAEISNTIQSVGSQILATESSVTKKLKTYKRERRSLTSDIRAFNARADAPGHFASSSTFNTQRKNLATRSTKLERSRVALNELIEKYNALVAQMAFLNAQATNLNAALGIDVSAMLPVPAEP